MKFQVRTIKQNRNCSSTFSDASARLGHDSACKAHLTASNFERFVLRLLCGGQRPTDQNGTNDMNQNVLLDSNIVITYRVFDRIALVCHRVGVLVYETTEARIFCREEVVYHAQSKQWEALFGPQMHIRVAIAPG